MRGRRKGFAGGLRRRGKVRIDGNRCMQSIEYRKQWLAAVVSADEGIPHKFCVGIMLEER